METLIKVDTSEVKRLFSNLELDGNKLRHQPGSVLGSIALIAGTTVGAGTLALPAVTLPSGVLPSTILLIAVWIYALVSGLLIAEVTLNTMRLLGRPSLGLLVIVEHTLGKLGAQLAGGAYVFIHYTLLVAYLSEGGEILGSVASKVWGVQDLLPTWLGTAAFALVFGGIMYLGRESFIEKLNNVFVAIVIASFLGLLLLGLTHVRVDQFLFQDWRALPSAVVIMFVAMYYHNVIPVIVSQLEGDARKIRSSIFIGSIIPLLMFLAWNAVILGSVSPDMIQATADSKSIFDPLEILRSGGSGEWLGGLISLFSEFAIVTSFIGFVYGLLNFFQDISLVAQDKPSNRLSLYSLVLFPPISFSVMNPSIFFNALDYAGTFNIFLAGIIPTAMTWVQRQEQEKPEKANTVNELLVPGGKLTLIVIFGISAAVILKQIISIYSKF